MRAPRPVSESTAEQKPSLRLRFMKCLTRRDPKPALGDAERYAMGDGGLDESRASMAQLRRTRRSTLRRVRAARRASVRSDDDQ